MGVLGNSIGLPLTGPLRGLTWLARQIAEAASREQSDPAHIEAALLALARQLEAGEIDEAQFEAQEADLLDRLMAIQARDEPAPPTGVSAPP
jgi:hypothetical protein